MTVLYHKRERCSWLHICRPYLDEQGSRGYPSHGHLAVPVTGDWPLPFQSTHTNRVQTVGNIANSSWGLRTHDVPDCRSNATPSNYSARELSPSEAWIIHLHISTTKNGPTLVYTGFEAEPHMDIFVTRSWSHFHLGDEPLPNFMQGPSQLIGWDSVLSGTSPSETVDTSGTCLTSHLREPCMSLLRRRLQERGSNPWPLGYEPSELPTALPCYKTANASDTCPTSRSLDPHMSLLWRWFLIW